MVIVISVILFYIIGIIATYFWTCYVALARDCDNADRGAARVIISALWPLAPVILYSMKFCGWLSGLGSRIEEAGKVRRQKIHDTESECRMSIVIGEDCKCGFRA